MAADDTINSERRMKTVSGTVRLLLTGKYRAERRPDAGGMVQGRSGHATGHGHGSHERRENVAHPEGYHFLGRVDHFSTACTSRAQREW